MSSVVLLVPATEEQPLQELPLCTQFNPEELNVHLVHPNPRLFMSATSASDASLICWHEHSELFNPRASFATGRIIVGNAIFMGLETIGPQLQMVLDFRLCDFFNLCQFMMPTSASSPDSPSATDSHLAAPLMSLCGADFLGGLFVDAGSTPQALPAPLPVSASLNDQSPMAPAPPSQSQPPAEAAPTAVSNETKPKPQRKRSGELTEHPRRQRRPREEREDQGQFTLRRAQSSAQVHPLSFVYEFPLDQAPAPAK